MSPARKTASAIGSGCTLTGGATRCLTTSCATRQRISRRADMQFLGKASVPIFGWTEGVQVEDKALDQLKNVASLPFIHKHVAVMPDVHWGMGATVGSVIPTVGAIIPAAVGVDIGCGMMAVRTGIKAGD